MKLNLANVPGYVQYWSISQYRAISRRRRRIGFSGFGWFAEKEGKKACWTDIGLGFCKT